MIELTPLWKTQFTKALCEMGLSDTEASECYSFTHGNLLSLFRRIPGNNADAQPKWAKEQGVELLCPIVFLRHFCTENSNIELTRDVAIGWFNSRGARFVTDGLAEKKTADQYRSYARSLEFEYPQTSKLLRMIADDFGREAKRDQQYSETFPQ